MKMNLPNQLTVLRVVLIFFCVVLANVGSRYPVFFPFLDFSPGFVYGCHVACYLLAIVAGFTDLLDGYLARKYNQVSDFGKLMDPLADKVFVTAILLLLVEQRLVPAWIAVAIISREFMVTGLRTLAVSKGVVVPADGWGKLKTSLQMVALAIGGASWLGWLPPLSLDQSVDMWRMLWMLALWVLVLITVGSGMSYFWRFRKLFMDSM